MRTILCSLLWSIALCPVLLAAGTLDYQKLLSGNGAVSIAGVATDTAGNVYLAGTTTAFDFPVKTAAQAVNSGTAATVSHDGGQTWSPLGFIPDIPFTGVEAPVASPKNASLLIASGVYGVYRSTDAGATWKTVVDLNVSAERTRIGYLDRVEFDPFNALNVYVSATTGVLKSSDSGATWTLLNNGIPAGNCCTGAGLAVDPLVQGRIVYTINDRAYVSSDGGSSWKPLTLPSIYSPTVIMDPFVAGTWYERDYQGFWISTDAGATWTRLPLNIKFFVAITPDPNVPGRVYGSTDQGLWRSNDRGQIWTQLTFPAAANIGSVDTFQVQPGNANWLVVGARSLDSYARNLGLLSKDGGQTWQSMSVVRSFAELRFDPAHPNVLYAAGPPTADVFVMKLGPAGDVIFATYLGGAGNDAAVTLALDGSGNIYVTGTTESSDFPGVTARLYQGLSPSLFVAKLNATGKPVQVTVLGGDSGATVYAFARDASGNLLLTGRINAPVIPATANALAQFPARGDGFVVKLSSDGGSFLYASALVGEAFSIATDQTGNFTLTGRFSFAGPSLNLIKLSPAGALLHSTLLPATPVKVVTDASGNLYVAGYAPGVDISCPNNSGTQPYVNRALYMTDVYLTKLDAQSSAVLFAKTLGGACRDTPTDLEVGADGSVWIAGDTYSDPFPLAGTVFGPPPPEFSRPFVTHLDATASTVLFSSYLDYGRGTSVAPDGNGNVYAGQSTPMYPYSGSVNYGLLTKLAATAATVAAPRRVVDAFRRANVPIAPQEIVVVELPGFQPAAEIDLGLQPAGGAPFVLGGVSVQFNGLAAPMLAVRNGEIECITPAALAGQTVAAVQVLKPGGPSGILNVDVGANGPAFYQVLNADGTVNTPGNPALTGSTVTLLFTGASLPASPATDGSIVGAGAAPVAMPLDVRFSTQFAQVQLSIPTVSAVAGYVAGMYAAKVQVPQITGTMTVTMFAGYPIVFPYPTVYPTIAMTAITGSVVISAAGIVNAASYAGGAVAPGEIVDLFGAGLGPETLATLQLDYLGHVSTALAGTVVLFDGVAAPVLFTQAGQVGAVVPYAVSGKSVTQVQVLYQGSTSKTVSMPVAAVAPGIFTLDASGRGAGAVLNQNGTVNSAANPAAVGEYISIFATGGGQTTPSGVDGKPADSPAPVPVAAVTATVAGVNATVQYAGGAPGLVAGVVQVNVQVPQGVTPGSAVAVVVTMGGRSTQANVTVAVR